MLFAFAVAIISDISIIQWPCSFRYTLSSKRQCVFAGTSNTLDFLPLDRTGNRRFLPVQVQPKLDGFPFGQRAGNPILHDLRCQAAPPVPRGMQS